MKSESYKVVLLFNANNIYDRQILKGIGDYLKLHNIHWNIYISETLRYDAKAAFHFDCDGIIANFDDPDIEDLLAKETIPIIGVGSSYHDHVSYPNVPYVAADNYAIIESAFNHLCEKGIYQFAFYSIPTTRYCRWAAVREKIFEQILAQKGYQGVIYQGMTTSLDNWQESLDKLSKWLLTLPINTGIIAVNDARAHHILQACDRVGIKIPEQLCLIGIDNEEVINNLSMVSLSTVKQGTEEMGFNAASLLNKQFAKGKISTEPLLIAPKKIIARRSTDYRSIQDPYVIQAMHYIRDYACKGIKVEQVISEMQISRSNLELRFKASLGKTIHCVIHEEKFNRAKYLLIESSLSIQMISEQCGYPSVQYFYFLFKKLYGMTPKDYRNKYAVNKTSS
ncbi:DNA-binding transcriptional regulator [Gilliamella sp. B3791]|uniref:XylR family transcriptional regulator n=1 Tax=unclassified Gilliamella TaxID=2685620 RepID=UPI0022698E27|nr:MULTISPECIES: DNA-binding transcriptional regulator [unclassified Gilliamella]MCX8643177.1 DNA-binding transcriptional regulator [Gilliamella sp. B3835]MCX8708568.1 DNA-binding transcriptional regulator [Gilliamella sp. B3783]MCX8742359.1 DNA-binding transcriptional regulator [Gilliamella sp. B3791]MCX8709642.1 DNA-binding transcriptional regulator [Gilliamella sp. B3780]MCX8717737.1 DNA-binding transcriptional regulator [Gilliamella sp. B3784]